jgi:ABC-2 type transport system ATP-binding protein
MIEVRGLTRYYGDHPAAVDLSFTISSNEVVGFLGLNGAGKSTTLKILAGLLLPSAGSVRIGGVDLLEAPDSIRARIGFLPEEPPLYRDMRVSDFIQYVGQLKGMPKAEVLARLPGVLKQCNIDDVADRVISELSLGYRKRVGIAQAIIHKPQLVILDEPISGLDPRQIREMRDLIVSLKRDSTVLVSSHILPEISQTCDRILVLAGGRLVAEGTEEELASHMTRSNRVQVSVRGSADAVKAALGDLTWVTQVNVNAQHGDIVSFNATLDGDRREELAAALVKAGLGLRRLDAASGELEEIFLNLTKEARA